MKKLEAQLRLWGLKIDRLAAKTLVPGVPASFDALTYIDELKALHAIAQSRFNAFSAAGDTERVRMRAEMIGAWNELDAAFKHKKRSSQR